MGFRRALQHVSAGRDHEPVPASTAALTAPPGLGVEHMVKTDEHVTFRSRPSGRGGVLREGTPPLLVVYEREGRLFRTGLSASVVMSHTR